LLKQCNAEKYIIYLSFITRKRKRIRLISNKLIPKVIYAKRGSSWDYITCTTVVGLKLTDILGWMRLKAKRSARVGLFQIAEPIAKVQDCHSRGSGNPVFLRTSGPPLSRGWHLFLSFAIASAN
jgi:hypothetical protein